MIHVPKAPFSLAKNEIQTTSFLEGLHREALGHLHPRSRIPGGQISVHFSICHDTRSLGLLFHVSEPQVLAKYTEDGEPVYRDSCVELFLELANEEYINLEFNCIGACLVQTGSDRYARKDLSRPFGKKIFRTASLSGPIETPVSVEKPWRLLLVIPMGDLGLDVSTESSILKGNIYKCGDDLPRPHWLSCFAVPTQKPDFHRPEYFGEFHLE